MRFLWLALFLFLSASQAFALQSQFLTDVSALANIKAETSKEIPNGVVLDNCSVSIPGVGEGVVGRLTVLNESPGKVGELIVENLRLPTVKIGELRLVNLRGNFLALALTLPLVAQFGDEIAASGPDNVKFQTLLQLLETASKDYHIDQVSLKNFSGKRGGVNFAAGSMEQENISAYSSGKAAIRDFTARVDAVVAFAAAEIGFAGIKTPPLERFNKLPGAADLSAVALFDNCYLNGFYIKKARVPLFDVSLDECVINLAYNDGKAQGSTEAKGVSAPGALLGLLGLVNLPDAVSANAQFNFRADVAPDSLVSFVNLAFSSPELCDLSVEGYANIPDGSDPSVTDFSLNFVDSGVVAMLPPEYKEGIILEAENAAPKLGEMARKLLSDQATSASVTLRDSRNMETLNVRIN